MNSQISIHILLVDDHEIVLNGIAELLRSSERPYEITLASSGKEALARLEKYDKPHVVVTDLDMGAISGKELCRLIKSTYPEIKVLVLSMHNEKGVIKDLLKTGANGYLTKTCGKVELNAAINAVLNGKKFYSTEVLESLSQEEELADDINMFLRHLSHRELEIMKLTSSGLSSKEIGVELNISHRTVETHRNNIIKKLGVKNVAGLIKVAVKSGLVD